jgi:hypothetical protein
MVILHKLNIHVEHMNCEPLPEWAAVSVNFLKVLSKQASF